MSGGKNGSTTLESLTFIEQLWRDYRAGNDVPPDWKEYFDRWRFVEAPNGNGVPGSGPGFFQGLSGEAVDSGNGKQHEAEAAAPRSQVVAPPEEKAAEREPSDEQPAEHAPLVSNRRLRAAYRRWGHLASKLDPLARERPHTPQLIALESLNGDAEQVAKLRKIYCGTVGYQFMHLEDPQARRWLARQIETVLQRPLGRREQLRILNRLTAAEGFEQFTRKKYVGAKTFSLAGSESLIPLLDAAIEQSANGGVYEIVLAMAHRGRLNVLINILGQRAQEIFRELEDQEGGRRPSSGDVRYHLGYSNDWLSQNGDRIHLSLSFNPSHLEFVNPVALGRLRAKQQRAGDVRRKRGMTVLLHGDAAFIGEGVVQESLNMAELPGYGTGGTLHVVIDNQLGFTTDPSEARSTTYSSDIALAFGAPVFHVNGDDAESVVRVAKLAVDYRQKFGRDVVIDLHCFRRWGHNESDEPSFTQPRMYRLIESHKSVREQYAAALTAGGRIAEGYGRQLQEKYAARLQTELEAAGRTRSRPRTPSLGGVWSGYVGGPVPEADQPRTAVEGKKLREWLAKLITVPEGFHLHPKLEQGLARRQEMIDLKRPLDWATCELLALGSLSMEGRPVRLSGQDCERGTFSQRHAVWHDTETGAKHMPVAHLGQNQAPIEVLNSPLAEAGVLGFEYGYSLDYPEALVAWEAQFGDFWNAAQVIFDQFVASAEDKWARLSGLVMLLPHGFEGQGPEHSSARLERFLVSAANDNYQVIVPSTPAQYFHCLRRQVLRRWRKPLVILTPKSLLRHHEVVSAWDDLEESGFQPVLIDAPREGKIRRVLLCTGKLYYDLAKAREELNRRDVALVRIEQLYPLPTAAIQSALAPFATNVDVLWCQEEPANMGAFHYLQSVWPQIAPERGPLVGITRPASASPATGSHAVHRSEQQSLLTQALE